MKTSKLRQMLRNKHGMSGVYQEENDSEFTHDGVRYNLNKVLQCAAAKPVQQMPVSRLIWVLDEVAELGDLDPARVERADTSAPLLVVVDTDHSNARATPVDGIHRLKKAVNKRMTTVPVVVLTFKELQAAHAEVTRSEK